MSDLREGPGGGEPRPPRVPEWLLAAVLRDPRVREDVLGDLHAAYQQYQKRSLVPGLRYWISALDVGIRFLMPRRSTRSRVRRSPRVLGGEKELLISILLQELRFAVRGVFRRPLFAGSVAGTLAFGIAGVTALASVVWGVLLAPLPYPDTDRLVGVWHARRGGEARHFAISPPQFEAFRGAQTIEELTHFDWGTAALHTDHVAEYVEIAVTAGNGLSFFGAEVALGRLYGPSDEAGDEPVVVLAHGTWGRRYGSDPLVLGTHVTLGSRDYRVIGVLGPDFRDPRTLTKRARPRVEYWIPRPPDEKRLYYLAVYARMQPGVTPAQVARELGPMVVRHYENLGISYEHGADEAATVLPLQEAVFTFFDTGRLWILFGTGAIVLLLACANVASLLLVRASERLQDLALRGAMGAGRGRLAVHLLSEAGVLSFLGGAFGVALAPLATKLVIMGAPEGIPRLESVQGLGWPMLATGLLVTTVTVLLIGTLPAWAHSRPRLEWGLKAGGTGARGGRSASRLRSGLLVAQVCGAFVVLFGTGLLMRSYRELATVDLGFRTDGILYGQVVLPTNLWEELGEWEQEQAYSIVGGTPELAEVQRVLKARLAAHPAIERVALAWHVPIVAAWGWDGSRPEKGWESAGPLQEGNLPGTGNRVDPSFFQVLDIPLLRGRFLTEEDGREGAPRVAVISEDLARQYFPGEDALGKRLAKWQPAFRDGAWTEYTELSEVVGVVASLRGVGIRGPSPTVYAPLSRAYGPTVVNYRNRRLSFFVESGSPAAVAVHIRAVVAEVLPGVPLRQFGALDDITAPSLREPRFYAYLIGFFGLYAALLAGLGIAASVAAIVSRRRWEIAVRVALGAPRRLVLRLVVGRATVLTVVGLVLGLGAGLFSARLLSSMLYGVTPLDPAMHLLTAVALLGIVVVAASLPVMRSLRLDPAQELRRD